MSTVEMRGKGREGYIMRERGDGVYNEGEREWIYNVGGNIKTERGRGNIMEE